MQKYSKFVILFFTILVTILIVYFTLNPSIRAYIIYNAPFNKTNQKTLLHDLKSSIEDGDEKNFYNSLRRLKNSKPNIPLVLGQIKNPNEPKEYTVILADYLDLKANDSSNNNEIINNLDFFKALILNKNEDVRIRCHLISAVTRGYSFFYGYNEQNYEQDPFLIPLLKSIIRDNSEDPLVIAQGIHSISRIKYKGMDDELLNIVRDNRSYSPFVVQSASHNLGRSNNSDAVSLFIDFINNTNNKDLFRSAVYSIGLTKRIDMIEPIINNYSRFGQSGENICRGTLRDNKDILISIIKNNEEELIIPAIIGLGKIREKAAVPLLKQVINENPRYKKYAIQAIGQIEEY